MRCRVTRARQIEAPRERARGNVNVPLVLSKKDLRVNNNSSGVTSQETFATIPWLGVLFWSACPGETRFPVPSTFWSQNCFRNRSSVAVQRSRGSQTAFSDTMSALSRLNVSQAYFCTRYLERGFHFIRRANRTCVLCAWIYYSITFHAVQSVFLSNVRRVNLFFFPNAIGTWSSRFFDPFFLYLAIVPAAIERGVWLTKIFHSFVCVNINIVFRQFIYNVLLVFR